MEVILRVVEGPEAGAEFRFEEAENMLVGRKDPTSEADLQIGPEDEYVSRNHFMFEIRPPNCLIRDNGSRNGTFVCRQGKSKWERVEETLVESGDRIRIGHTILALDVVLPEPVGVSTRLETLPWVREGPAGSPRAKAPEPPPAPPPPAPATEVLCIRCGGPLLRPPALTGGNLRPRDFMCPACQAQVAAQRERKAAAPAAVKYQCSACRQDVTARADADGQAAELAEVALYLCPACAGAARKLRDKEIGGYTLLSELGRGGMGVVYKALHPATGRVAAVKQILPIAKADDDTVLRFLREISIMEALRGAGVVWIYEAGRSGDSPFFVSEFAPDGSLGQFVSKEGRPTLPVREAVELMAAALEGLAFTHGKGYVHRDLKPENILLRKANGHRQPKLADFGLARSYEKHGGTITKAGQFMGTIVFMPPEQIRHCRGSKPTVDVYAMGVTLYHLLTGNFPLNFLARPLLKDPVRMVLEDARVPIAKRRSDLPPALCAAVDRAVAADASRRPQTADEFRQDLLKALKR
jgi:serine/threonine-protein kinase